MTSITAGFSFDAAHRVLGHKRCGGLHGHRYRAEVTVANANESFRGLDHSPVGVLIGNWILEHWDHGLILNPEDPLLLTQLTHPRVLGVRPFVLPIGDPTPEALATVLGEAAEGLLASMGLKVLRVRLWESPDCYADYEPASAVASSPQGAKDGGQHPQPLQTAEAGGASAFQGVKAEFDKEYRDDWRSRFISPPRWDSAWGL